MRKLSDVKRVVAGGLCALALGAAGPASAVTTPEAEVDAFVERMVTEHGFDREGLERDLAKARVSETILSAIARPAERVEPWYEYRRRVSRARIDAGQRFLADHGQALARARERYGVSEAVIVAILGLETNYGTYPLKHRVLDALYTLAFHYPPRAGTFLPQFEDFLILAREEAKPVESFMGSYAGAMGVPQFMPISFRTWAVDFDGDGARDIWDSMDDVIGSVAAYLAAHGWREDAPIAVPVSYDGGPLDLARGVKPKDRARAFLKAGVRPKIVTPIPVDAPASLLELEVADGVPGYWLVFENFYAITRYNASAKYAMVIAELASKIAATGAAASR